MIDAYVLMVKLWYVYLLEKKNQNFLKLNCSVIHALKIRKKDNKGQIEPGFDSYKKSLKNIMNSNIDNKIPSRSNLLRLFELNALVWRLKRAILQLTRVFDNGSRANANKGNDLGTILLGNASSKLS